MTSTTLVINAQSGGGRHQGAILEAARRRGWTTSELGPGQDAATLARTADSDLLAVAGGDGTVGAVASVAAERDLPLLVIPAGTLNHFAVDAGLDVDHPVDVLDAAESGYETRIDLGEVNGTVFLNNASLGFYPSMVADPLYRRRRVATTAKYVRRAVLGSPDALRVTTDVPTRIHPPRQVLSLLVANNAYSPGVAPGAALRPSLDDGVLWIHLLGSDVDRGPVPARLARTVLGLLTARTAIAAWPTTEQRITTDRQQVDVALDGEPRTFRSPLEFVSRPAALRLLRPLTGRPSPATFAVQV